MAEADSFTIIVYLVLQKIKNIIILLYKYMHVKRVYFVYINTQVDCVVIF